MMSEMNAGTWFLDFDDTLVSGPMTWALEQAIPKLIARHQLPADPAKLDPAVLHAQERAAAEYDPAPILDEFFETLGWPHSLERELFEDVQRGYHPQPFSDVIPFLQGLRQRARAVYILSNNPRSPQIAAAIQIDSYIDAFFTPQTCPGTQPKPSRSMWDWVQAHHPAIQASDSCMVGDDPWSDALFAQSAGIPCWIVDRFQRLDAARQRMNFRTVNSLLEILEQR